MPYTIPTFEQQRDAILTDFANQFDDADISEHSDLYVWACVLAAIGEGEYSYLDFLSRQVTPAQSTDGFLDRWAGVYNLLRKALTAASGTATATGTAGSIIDEGELLTYVGGQQYLTTAEAEIPAGGEVTLSVVAAEAGVDSNREAGDVLTFDAPPEGVDAEATVVAITSGLDTELDDDLRGRVLLRTQNVPGGGNRTDWERWALEEDGVSAVSVMSVRRGLGTVDVVVLGPASARIVSETVVGVVEAALEARRPVTCDLAVHTAEASSLDVELELVPAEGYEFDWAGTRTVQVDSTAETVILDSVADLVEGDRIVIGLEQREIASVDAGAVSVTVTEAFSEAPSAGETVYPGGPLYEPVRDAIQAYFAALDPMDTWYLNACEAQAAVAGVLNQTVTSPAADQALSDDDTETGPSLHTLGSLIITEAA